MSRYPLSCNVWHVCFGDLAAKMALIRAWVLNRAYFVIGQFDLKKDFTGSLQNQ